MSEPGRTPQARDALAAGRQPRAPGFEAELSREGCSLEPGAWSPPRAATFPVRHSPLRPWAIPPPSPRYPSTPKCSSQGQGGCGAGRLRRGGAGRWRAGGPRAPSSSGPGSPHKRGPSRGATGSAPPSGERGTRCGGHAGRGPPLLVSSSRRGAAAQPRARVAARPRAWPPSPQPPAPPRPRGATT